MNCIYCEKPLVGRVDKIYCDSYCKSAHFNEKRKKDGITSFFKKVDDQLKTNRKILKHFNVEGYSTIKKEILQEKGFDSNFFTHYWKSQKGNVYLFCYEFGFLSLKNKNRDKYLLVQWQDYMNESNNK